ncbi:hypothetical protein FHS75_003024 [Novosphingobium marinum]|uniref:Uncharacterized protein n=1 Tax=Novosphingobium marinum TaxID=1514948 RepID=A0A7Y9Y0V1_9SPHN|nr:hypothetical protein [Novosphingobium marinum]
MIAGDHLDRDAGRSAFGDRPLRLLARRIDEPHQSQHPCILQICVRNALS